MSGDLLLLDGMFWIFRMTVIPYFPWKIGVLIPEDQRNRQLLLVDFCCGWPHSVLFVFVGTPPLHTTDRVPWRIKKHTKKRKNEDTYHPAALRNWKNNARTSSLRNSGVTCLWLSLIENITSYPMTPNGLSSCSTFFGIVTTLANPPCQVGESQVDSHMKSWKSHASAWNPRRPWYPGVFFASTSYQLHQVHNRLTPVSQKTSSRVDWRYFYRWPILRKKRTKITTWNDKIPMKSPWNPEKIVSFWNTAAVGSPLWINPVGDITEDNTKWGPRAPKIAKLVNRTPITLLYDTSNIL